MAEDLAPAEDLIGGLNDIVGFVSIGGEKSERGRWGAVMEKTSSRIPKLNFGFRKVAKNSTGAQSEGNSSRMVGVAKTNVADSQPAGSTNTSPKRTLSGNLARSKSMRVTRSVYHNAKENSGPLTLEHSRDSDDIEEDLGGSGGLQMHRMRQEVTNKPESAYCSHPQNKMIGSYARSSLRLISRSVSPRGPLGVRKDPEEEEEDEQSPQPENNIPIGRDRRTKSFTAHHQNRLGNGSLSSTTSHSSSPSAMSRANSTRRSKTPTSLYSSVHSNGTSEYVDKGYNSQGEKKLARRGSQTHLKNMSTKLAPPSQQNKVLIRKPVPNSRSARPHSSSIHANDPEASSPLDGSGNKSSLGIGGGGMGQRSHSSIGYTKMAEGTPSPDSTPQSNQHTGTGSGRVTPTRTSGLLTTKSCHSSLDESRPHSATAYYQKSPHTSLSKESTVAQQENRVSSRSRRGSTPSSGRSTPVQPGMEGKEITDGGVLSNTPKTSSGLPPRTPYRVARTKAAPANNLAGMNELEGSVLLEADDYRRLFNEVKALKTALLRLKRELQEESDGVSSPASHVGHLHTSPLPGQMSVMEYNKRLRAVGKERDAASDEITKVKKDSKSKDARIEALTLELALVKEQQIATSEELQQVTEQRDRLIVKVERLHAEKHQVEARLNTLERAAMYEQTLSDNWLDELDGEADDALRESLENGQRSFTEGGRKKGSTGSDVVDSGMQSDGDGEESSEA